MKNTLKSILNHNLSDGKTLNDYLDILNIYIKFHNVSNTFQIKPLEIDQFQQYYRNINKKYITFSIPKKNGDPRIISAPDKYLIKIQRIIMGVLLMYFEPSSESHGFIHERSIVSNAEMHTNKAYVLNVDLKDFFPSVKYAVIKDLLQKAPFQFNENMAGITARFCVLYGKLPQGAPTSPILSNIAANNLDKKLVYLSHKYKQTYTRYADDITFSGYRRIYTPEFFKELNKIIEEENFEIKKSKTRIQTKNKRQVVTGITVNEKLNVNRKYIKELRAMIHHYKTGRGADNAFAVISGKLEFLKMVKGKDRVYRNLIRQFKE